MTTKMYALGEVKALKSDDPNGEFEVILSAPSLDRDGEIIDAKAFEPLPDHITFDIDHGMSTATTVGSGVPSYDGDVLKVKGMFSSIPRAQEVRTLVAEGHIRTTSVAFMDAKRETKDGVDHITRAELLNGAFVPIPSNRDALVLSAKRYAAKVGARNSAADAERLQVIHDYAVDAGATCEAKSLSIGRMSVDIRAAAPARKGHGMTANDLREVVSAAVNEAHLPERGYVWVRDYTDEWVVFELETVGGTSGTFQQPYTVADRVATLTGDPVEVTVRTIYEPISTSTTDSAPGTAADEAAKSPASVVAQARLATARASLLLATG